MKTSGELVVDGVVSIALGAIRANKSDGPEEAAELINEALSVLFQLKMKFLRKAAAKTARTHLKEMKCRD